MVWEWRLCERVNVCTTQYYVIWTFVTRLLNSLTLSIFQLLQQPSSSSLSHIYSYSLDPFHLKTMCLFEQWQLNAMFAHLLLRHGWFCEFSQCISICTYVCDVCSMCAYIHRLLQNSTEPCSMLCNSAHSIEMPKKKYVAQCPLSATIYTSLRTMQSSYCEQHTKHSTFQFPLIYLRFRLSAYETTATPHYHHPFHFWMDRKWLAVNVFSLLSFNPI